jgi:hypothetical protein
MTGPDPKAGLRQYLQVGRAPTCWGASSSWPVSRGYRDTSERTAREADRASLPSLGGRRRHCCRPLTDIHRRRRGLPVVIGMG